MTIIEGDLATLPHLPFAGRVSGIPGSVIDNSTSLLARQKHDVVSFAMGSPAPETVPAALLADLASEVLVSDPASFGYGATEGEPALRAELLKLVEGGARAVDSDELLVSAGGMQGLDLACKLFVGPGDIVATESPTYTNATAVITSYGGRLVEVPTDAEGMVVDALAELVDPRSPPKLVYVIPNFQNPTGVTMSLARRLALLELAARWGAVLLEDDPYSLLRFGGHDIPSLVTLAGPEVCVVSVHTFSKIIAPGLRVGWVTAPRAVVSRMIDAKQGVDTCTNVPMQRVIASFMARGHLERHLTNIRRDFSGRKERMQLELSDAFDSVPVTWTDPDGGLFLWITLPDHVDTAKVFPDALAHGVAFIPGKAFSPSGHFANSLRLCFASTDAARMRLGIQRLRAVLDGYLTTSSPTAITKE